MVPSVSQSRDQKMMKNILILAALPFRKYGNQSMLRFVNMFLNNHDAVTMVTSGSDSSGEQVILNKNFKLIRINCLMNIVSYLGCKLKSILTFKHKNIGTIAVSRYQHVMSSEVLPPFARHTKTLIVKRWIYFFIIVLDNIFLGFRLIVFNRKILKFCDCIIAYECEYFLCAKLVSKIYGKKYVNKYQGTVLKTTGRSLADCILYYPLNYFGINSSDLCIMVNDGSDGCYYAKIRGCSNILFQPHGVDDSGYRSDLSTTTSNKFKIVNLASTSPWKRVDRVVRALKFIRADVLDLIEVVSTYSAADRDELVQYSRYLGVDKSIQFIQGLNHIECNSLLRRSDLLISTNDMSNLGNPVLEAIYYGIPVLSIKDRSTDGFLNNGKDSVLIDLSGDFDRKVASAITRMVTDSLYYKELKAGMKNNSSVNSLEFQQNIEYESIVGLLGS